MARDGDGASSDSSGHSMLISNDATAQGFTIIEAVLDGTEVAELARTLESADLDRSRAGARHLMSHPAVSDVAVDPRMVAIAGRFLGETAIPYKATLFDKSPARNWLVAWHQDTALPLCERFEVPEWGPWSIKAAVTYALAPASALAQVVALRLHLDDSRADNGPLRVLPGTHTLGLLTESDIARLTTEVPPWTAPLRPVASWSCARSSSTRRPRRKAICHDACCTSSTHGHWTLEMA